jgi:hypothetical protein
VRGQAESHPLRHYHDEKEYAGREQYVIGLDI